MKNLREFLSCLKKENELIVIDKEVDPYLEIAEIHRCIALQGGPALFFSNVKNSPFPVVTNLFGTAKRVELAFKDPYHHLQEVVALVKKGDFSFKSLWKRRSILKKFLHLGQKKSTHGYFESSKTLDDLPLLQLWPEDGGHFITLPLVYTQSPLHQTPNLGMYRMQRFDSKTLGLHMQIGKGGGYHLKEAQKLNRPLDVNVYLGGPPALILSAITPLPENVSELLLCSFLLGQKLSYDTLDLNPYPLLTECEFALVGQVDPFDTRLEGPFGDHYGYYSLKHPFPYFKCHKIYQKKDAIFPATVVGKPYQEDFYIGNYLQKMLSPIFPLVMPNIEALWSYGECGFHNLGACIVKQRYAREAVSAAFRVLGEGQLSLTKFLLVTDQKIDLENFKLVFQTVLERFSPQKDLYIFSNLSLDTLDYSGPKLNEGSRGVLIGCGESKRKLPTKIPKLPSCVIQASIYVPGCLVIELDKNFDDIASLYALLEDFPMVFIVDDAEKTASCDANFLWTCFTRFEPAANIHSRYQIFRHHLCYEFPIIIDARMKPSYPKETLPDLETQRYVEEHWDDYFQEDLMYANSASGNVY